MNKPILFILLIIGLVALFLANLLFGSIHIEPAVVWEAIVNPNSDDTMGFIVRESRLPTACTALLAGSALGVAGLMLQTLFRNPLAGPSILGISSGASLGVALVVLFFAGTLSLGFADWSGTMAITIGAVLGSAAVMGALIFFSSYIRSDLLLLITGIMAGYLASSLVTLLSSLATAEGIQGYVSWGMGTFNAVTMDSLLSFTSLILLSLLLSMFLCKPLNLLLLGYDYARNLGINIKRVRNCLLIISSLLTAIVTAWCGPISFIGLTIPHISRLLFRTDNHLILLPATMLSGAIIALACNVASTIPDNSVIPINALTPLFGVPVILYIILKKRG